MSRADDRNRRDDIDGGARRVRSPSRRRWGIALIALVLLFATLGPSLRPYAPNVPDFEHGMARFGTAAAPDARHWFGTDALFRDLFVRLAHGARLSLRVALIASALSVGAGALVGIAAAAARGVRLRVDRLGERVAALSVLVALPSLRLAPAFAHGVLVIAEVTAAAACLARAARALGGATTSMPRRRRALAADVFAFLAAAALVAAFAARPDRWSGSAWPAAWLLAAAAAAALEGGPWAVVESQARALGTVDADDLLMRAVDVLLAFPTLLLLLAIGALVDRTSELTLIATLAFTGWPAIARVVRSKALEVLAMPYVEAARALGGSNARVLFRHVAPATLPLLGVLATNAVAAFIVAEAALAFLGLSVPPPQASWGRMLEEGRPYVSTAPWLLAAPATALFVSVLGFHLLTEGVADGERDER